MRVNKRVGELGVRGGPAPCTLDQLARLAAHGELRCRLLAGSTGHLGAVAIAQ